MRTLHRRFVCAVYAVVVIVVPRFGIAQQVTGVSGAPSATTTIDGKQLPAPDPKFGGVIKENALDSKPWWAPRIVPPQGAPNVLLIMTDDSGFGVPSTFGGVIPTPALDRIANNGLRYTNFNSTALCSPTRAALITGRNHHSVGFGVISEQATGYPGYDSIITKDKATIGKILKDNGYRTSWFGKNHNTPAFQASADGPFDQWPIGMGTLAFNNMSGIGRSGTGVLKVDGKEVASQKMERTLPLILQWDENFDVGADTGTPVNDADYQVPFKFTGKLTKLTLSIDRPKLTPEDEKKLMQATRNNKVSE
jgi:arylsulfatase A-like enzyme